jgi:hypothetical protein
VVLDLAPDLSTPALERLIAEVVARDPQAEHELARRGAKRIQSIVTTGARRTRSSIERRLLNLIRDAGLPTPLTNAEVAGHEVDDEPVRAVARLAQALARAA